MRAHQRRECQSLISIRIDDFRDFTSVSFDEFMYRVVRSLIFR